MNRRSLLAFFGIGLAGCASDPRRDIDHLDEQDRCPNGHWQVPTDPIGDVLENGERILRCSDCKAAYFSDWKEQGDDVQQ